MKFKPRYSHPNTKNQSKCIPKFLSLTNHHIKKYIQPAVNSYKIPEIKQYDIVKITQVKDNNYQINENVYKNPINTDFIVYTGDDRSMSYNDFLEYENPRGIKSQYFNNDSSRTTRALEFIVLNDDMLNRFFKYKNRDEFKARVIKDQEQYYRRRLK